MAMRDGGSMWRSRGLMLLLIGGGKRRPMVALYLWGLDRGWDPRRSEADRQSSVTRESKERRKQKWVLVAGPDGAHPALLCPRPADRTLWHLW